MKPTNFQRGGPQQKLGHHRRLKTHTTDDFLALFNSKKLDNHDPYISLPPLGCLESQKRSFSLEFGNDHSLSSSQNRVLRGRLIEFEGADNVSPINPPQRVRREL